MSNLTYFLALKYLRKRRKLMFSTHHMLALTGIVIGVLATIIIVSILNGMQHYMIEHIVKTKSEIWVHNKDYSSINNYAELTDKFNNEETKASPVSRLECMISTEGKLAPALCYGVDIDFHRNVVDLDEQNVIGEINKGVLEENGIALGMDLSINLNVTVGEYVTITSPEFGIPTPFGLMPAQKKLKVISLIDTGMPDYNTVIAYVSLKNAQYLKSQKNECDYIAVSTDNPFTSISTAEKIQGELGDKYLVENWTEFDSNIYKAIKIEKFLMFFVISIMFVIVAFNISSNFIKMITEKNYEIGIMKAMGVTDRTIRNLFVTSGAVIAVTGLVIGVIVALLFSYLQIKFRLISVTIPGFPIRSLPIIVDVNDYLIVSAVVILISIVASWYPARKALLKNPIDVIRCN